MALATLRLFFCPLVGRVMRGRACTWHVIHSTRHYEDPPSSLGDILVKGGLRQWPRFFGRHRCCRNGSDRETPDAHLCVSFVSIISPREGHEMYLSSCRGTRARFARHYTQRPPTLESCIILWIAERAVSSSMPKERENNKARANLSGPATRRVQSRPDLL